MQHVVHGLGVLDDLVVKLRHLGPVVAVAGLRAVHLHLPLGGQPQRGGGRHVHVLDPFQRVQRVVLDALVHQPGQLALVLCDHRRLLQRHALPADVVRSRVFVDLGEQVPCELAVVVGEQLCDGTLIRRQRLLGEIQAGGTVGCRLLDGDAHVGQQRGFHERALQPVHELGHGVAVPRSRRLQVANGIVQQFEVLGMQRLTGRPVIANKVNTHGLVVVADRNSKTVDLACLLDVPLDDGIQTTDDQRVGRALLHGFKHAHALDGGVELDAFNLLGDGVRVDLKRDIIPRGGDPPVLCLHGGLVDGVLCQHVEEVPRRVHVVSGPFVHALIDGRDVFLRNAVGHRTHTDGLVALALLHERRVGDQDAAGGQVLGDVVVGLALPGQDELHGLHLGHLHLGAAQAVGLLLRGGLLHPLAGQPVEELVCLHGELVLLADALVEILHKLCKRCGVVVAGHAADVAHGVGGQPLDAGGHLRSLASAFCRVLALLLDDALAHGVIGDALRLAQLILGLLQHLVDVVQHVGHVLQLGHGQVPDGPAGQALAKLGNHVGEVGVVLGGVVAVLALLQRPVLVVQPAHLLVELGLRLGVLALSAGIQHQRDLIGGGQQLYGRIPGIRRVQKHLPEIVGDTLDSVLVLPPRLGLLPLLPVVGHTLPAVLDLLGQLLVVPLAQGLGTLLGLEGFAICLVFPVQHGLHRSHAFQFQQLTVGTVQLLGVQLGAVPGLQQILGGQLLDAADVVAHQGPLLGQLRLDLAQLRRLAW